MNKEDNFEQQELTQQISLFKLGRYYSLGTNMSHKV